MAKDRSIFPLRLEAETTTMIKALYESDNCSSQTEFIKKAIKFYISYLTTNKETNFLNPMILNAIKSAIIESENKNSSNLFRLAVETGIMMNIMAYGLEITDEQLKQTRARVIKEVKSSRGQVSFEKAVSHQRGDD